MIITHDLICSITSTWKKKEENKLPTQITIIFMPFSNKVKEKERESAGNRPVSYSRPHWGEWRKTHQSEANAGKEWID